VDAELVSLHLPPRRTKLNRPLCKTGFKFIGCSLKIIFSSFFLPTFSLLALGCLVFTPPPRARPHFLLLLTNRPPPFPTQRTFLRQDLYWPRSAAASRY